MTTSFLGVMLFAFLSLFSLFKTTTVFAEEQTIYPESFISNVNFKNLSDYAVGGDGYLFIDEGYLYRYIRGTTASSSSYTATNIEAKSCHYSDGAYYYVDSTDTVRTFSDNQPTDYVIPTFETIDFGGYIYSRTGGIYYAWDKATTSTELKNVFSLKRYANFLYAIFDGGIVTINGVDVVENALGTLQYLDYGLSETMPVGNLEELLKSTSVSFATISVGAYMTELDLNSLSGEYLAVGQTLVSDGGTGLVLAKTGNASVILLDGTTYITLTALTTPSTLSYETTPTFSYAKVNLLGGAVYSTAYASKATQIEVLAEDTGVNVLGHVSSSVFGGTFYRISYQKDGETKTGYIPTAFVIESEYAENNDSTVADPNYQIDSLVQRVILIVAIILLILIAVIYLIHISTRGKKKDKKRKSEQNGDQDKQI